MDNEAFLFIKVGKTSFFLLFVLKYSAIIWGGMNMADNNYLSYQEDSGSINISEEVILTIVRGAALDVKGVSSLSTTAGAELAELIGLKTIPKGVSVRLDQNTIVADVIINVAYGNNIVNVAKAVQESARNVIQATTGFDGAIVNVHVSGITFDR